MRTVRRIEVPPVVFSLGAGMAAVLISAAGYLFKTWTDSITYEIHQLRLTAEKQLIDSAANNEWKSDMSKWRDSVDKRLSECDKKGKK